MIRDIHHIALIVKDHERSCHFYQTVFGFIEMHRVFRAERNSWKIDLQLNKIRLELFTFPDAPERPSYPEAQGLRHLAFSVTDVRKMHAYCMEKTVTEPLRIDPYTEKEFFFLSDPDGIPIEIYEE